MLITVSLHEATYVFPQINQPEQKNSSLTLNYSTERILFCVLKAPFPLDQKLYLNALRIATQVKIGLVGCAPISLQLKRQTHHNIALVTAYIMVDALIKHTGLGFLQHFADQLEFR